jgi:hypothetical protein
MITVMGSYPRWRYYPASNVPPSWVTDLTGVFSEAKAKIDTSMVQGKKSDGILASLCPGLVELGYQVETSKKAIDPRRVHR